MATPPDFTAGQVLTAAQMNKIGMWLISTTTINATSTSFNNVFTSDYRNYRIVIDSFQQSVVSGVNIRMRKNGVDDTSANYQWSYRGAGQSGAAADYAGQNQTYGFMPLDVDNVNTVWGGGAWDVLGPQLNQRTIWKGGGVSYYATLGWFTYYRDGYTYHNVVNQYDGFTFYTGAGNIGCTLTIYGYNS